ncbi:hypothetical protein BDF20DRAFT_819952, partial [Mycotypha africana]|uniref:uncharacterized protein n=1 Tax=Mycotypha africana TaxID=64632 RepID=UPI0022FFE1A8
MVIRDPLARRPASPSLASTASVTHHKGCNSATCCSPAKIWRTLQTLIKEDDPGALIKHFEQADEQRLQHIVRVALTARLSNDASLYPPSQQHKLVRLTSREAMLCFGKSFRDLNSLQLALLASSEATVLALFTQLKSYAESLGEAEKWSSFINHIWGQGNTTLHLAAHLQRREVIKQLLELECCKIHVRNARNRYPEDCC